MVEYQESAMNLFGMNIQVSPLLGPQPKMQLSTNPKPLLSYEFREEFDAWLAEFFGYTDDHAVQMGNTLFVSREAYTKLRREAEEVKQFEFQTAALQRMEFL